MALKCPLVSMGVKKPGNKNSGTFCKSGGLAELRLPCTANHERQCNGQLPAGTYHPPCRYQGWWGVNFSPFQYKHSTLKKCPETGFTKGETELNPLCVYLFLNIGGVHILYFYSISAQKILVSTWLAGVFSTNIASIFIELNNFTGALKKAIESREIRNSRYLKDPKVSPIIKQPHTKHVLIYTIFLPTKDFAGHSL